MPPKENVTSFEDALNDAPTFKVAAFKVSVLDVTSNEVILKEVPSNKFALKDAI